MAKKIPVFDRVEEYHNCFVQILSNSKTGAVSIGWKPEDTPDSTTEMQMDLYPIIENAKLIIKEQQRIIRAMRNCTNCARNDKCKTVQIRKAEHANDYSPCKKWKILNMSQEANKDESAT